MEKETECEFENSSVTDVLPLRVDVSESDKGTLAETDAEGSFVIEGDAEAAVVILLDTVSLKERSTVDDMVALGESLHVADRESVPEADLLSLGVDVREADDDVSTELLCEAECELDKLCDSSAVVESDGV